jgi:uncharacterized protein YuzE
MKLRFQDDILYIQVREGEVEDTLELDPDTYMDVDKDGNALAYEFWEGEEILEKLKQGVTLEFPDAIAHA